MSDIADINEIRELLAHRYPFLLVDRVLEFELGKSIVALKNVTVNEPFFSGHFPTRPIMPGVLLIEALAQTAGVLVLKSAEKSTQDIGLQYLVGVNKARFKRVVIPGDQLRLEVEILRRKQNFCKFSGRVTVDGELACETELMTTIGA